MSEIISAIFSKISSYQIFINLIPGIIFVCVFEVMFPYTFTYTESFARFVIYYLVGAIINRVGSLVVEPVFRKRCWAIFSSRDNFCKARLMLEKIDTLNTENNFYRSMISLIVLFIIVYLLDCFALLEFFMFSKVGIIIDAILLLLLFSFAYSKQTSYVRKTVHTTLGIDDSIEVEKLKKIQKGIKIKEPDQS